LRPVAAPLFMMMKYTIWDRIHKYWTGKRKYGESWTIPYNTSSPALETRERLIGPWHPRGVNPSGRSKVQEHEANDFRYSTADIV
jgi:hypothetical protein